MDRVQKKIDAQAAPLVMMEHGEQRDTITTFVGADVPNYFRRGG
jgi:hypothetical protein